MIHRLTGQVWGRRALLGQARSRASFSLAFTGLSTDTLGAYGQLGTHASIGFTVNPTGAVNETKWSASSNPLAAATFGTGTAPTDFTAADGFQVFLHVRRGTEWVTQSFLARRAPGAFAALVNQSFTDDTGPQIYQHAAGTGTGITWTYAQVGLLPNINYVPGTRTFTFDTDALAVQSGTGLTVRATDQYGRFIDQIFTLTITANIAVNPNFTGLDFADPGDGVADTLTATYSYGGADTLRAFVAIRNGGAALTAAQLRNGTGTFLERVVVNPFSAASFDITGFTAVSEAGTAIDVAIAEVTNGGLSSAQTVAVTGLDFTRPVFSSAQATNANTVVVTFSQPIFGTGVPANWAFNINGSPATITAAVLSGSTVTLTVSNTMTNGQTLNALAYVPGDLDDQDGNLILTFSGQSITNSIPASGFVLDGLTGIQAAYSIRRLRTAYTGPLIRVRRSSDNAETDVGYDGSGNLDTTAMLAFVGANTGTMSVIYDQSGNGINLPASGAPNSPRIVNAGVLEVIGTRPAPFYDGGDRMGSASSLTLTINTINAVILRNTTATNAVIMAANAQGGGEAAHLRYTAAFAYNAFKGAAAITAGTLPASRTVVTAVGQDAGSARVFANGVQVATGTAWGTGNTLTGTDFMAIGGRPSGAVSDTAQAHIPEAIMFSAALSTAERTALENNQLTYYV